MLTSSCDLRSIWDLKTVGTSSPQGWDKAIQSGGQGESKGLWLGVGVAPRRGRRTLWGKMGPSPEAA